MSRQIKFIEHADRDILEQEVNEFVRRVAVISVQYQVRYLDTHLGRQCMHSVMIFYDTQEELLRILRGYCEARSKKEG